MDILIAQTAAGPVYEEMLAATDALHQNYCDRYDIRFQSIKGVRRGFHPWQATFNRIEISGDLADDGWRGWFVYLDADCVIRQPVFNLRQYLAKRNEYALIAAPAAPACEPWDINAGVFFLNLAHPEGRKIALRWRDRTHAVVTTDMLLAAAQPWQNLPDGSYFPDDQHLLHMTLRDHPDIASTVLLERDGLINSAGGRFIQQIMRHIGSPTERLAAMRGEVARVSQHDLG